MLAGLAVAGVYSYMNQPTPTDRRYFEADGNGRLVSKERPASTAAKAPKLYKPEPSFLLVRGSDLGLSQVQLRKIEAISARWKAEKFELERAMEAAVETVDPSAKASVPVLTSDLGGYSELSRAFGARRESAWRSAVGVLDGRQRKKLSGIEAEVRR